MSIDALIQAHIEALNTNTKAVEMLTLSLAGRTPKPEEKAKKEDVLEKGIKDGAEAMKAVAEKIMEEEKKDDVPDFEVKELKDLEPKKEPPILLDHTPIAYETVRALVLKLAGAGKREEIKALNAKHGIANLKVLLGKEDDFSTVNDQAKLEAVYADLQALEA